MDIAIIRLGKMGGNLARRLLKGGHRVVGLDHAAELIRKLAAMRNAFGGYTERTIPS
jgi:6-phosphogluconate dehydrogenase